MDVANSAGEGGETAPREMNNSESSTGIQVSGQNALHPAFWTVAAIAVLLIFAAISASVSPATKDYISYWSAGKLLRQHGNPYAAAQVLAVENGSGYANRRPIVMRNPPWALPVVLPLGYTRARTGLVGWLAVSLGCMAFFFARCRVASGDRLVLCCLPPVLSCLITGQSSPFLLLGLVGFLGWERSKPWLAGAMLLFLAFKPHAVFLFWPILLAECVYRRKLRLLAGALLSLAGASLIAMLYDPRVWQHYWAMLHDEQIGKEMLPTPSFLLRFLIAPEATWIQVVPAAFALVWAIWFFSRNRARWDWRVHAVPLLFVSVLASPYVWFTDQVLLLPAIATTLLHASPSRHARVVLVVLSCFTFGMLLHFTPGSIAYSWTSLAWAGWYLYSRGWSTLRAPQDRIAIEMGTT